MTFWEKWYWENFVRGTNPFTTFFWGLVSGLWIPIVLSAILCFFIDPQWQHHESMAQWNPIEFGCFYCWFWRIVFYTFGHYAWVYASYFWHHTGEIARFVRQVLWLDR